MPTRKEPGAKRLSKPRSTTRLTIPPNVRPYRINGQSVLMSDEDRLAFEKLRDDVIAGLAPGTFLEHCLANSIAWDTWRLDRLRTITLDACAIRTQTHEAVNDGLGSVRSYLAAERTFHKMSLCEQRMRRNIQMELSTFRSIQKDRKLQDERDRNHDALLTAIRGLAN